MNHETLERRSLLKGIGVAGVAGISGLAGCSGGGSDNEQTTNGGGEADTTRYTMGGGASGSSTWSTAQALQQLLRDNTDNIRVTGQQTGGTKANLRLYDEGTVQIIGTSNYLYDQAKQGVGAYAENPIESFPQQAFEYGVTHTYFLAREDTDIEMYSDLQGANVWPLWSGSSIRLPMEDYLKEIGLWDQMNIRDMDPGDVAGALEAGRLDALAVYGVSYKGLSGWATQVDSRADLKLVQMSDEKKQQLDDFLASGSETIEPYGWENQNFSGSVTSIPMNFRIFFGDEVSEDHGYTITKLVHENGEQLTEQVTILPDISEADTLTQGTLAEYPVHPGVAKYLKEIDAWNDDWTMGSV